MKWHEHDRSTWVSEDGRYSVCRVTYVTAQGPQPRYEVHVIGKGPIQREGRNLNFIDRHTAQLAAETYDATGG